MKTNIHFSNKHFSKSSKFWSPQMFGTGYVYDSYIV